MPVDRDDVDGAPAAVRPGTNKHRVLTFLAANDGQAFTRAEVAEGAGVPANSVGPVLSRLREDELVEYHDGYWTVAAEEDLGFLADLLDAVEDLAGRFDADDLRG